MSPFKSTPRYCKYCDELAKKNIINGRNKGWLRTCGSKKCLTEQYRDKSVSKTKIQKEQLGICKTCGKTYTKKTWNHTWCLDCAPDIGWRAKARRYGIGKPQWERIVLEQGGTCKLCPGVPSVVDHAHETGKVRGIICWSCNILLAGLDADKAWIERAKEYLK